MDTKRELEIARDAMAALEQCLFDGPVPEDGNLIYKRAIQLRKIEQAALSLIQDGLECVHDVGEFGVTYEISGDVFDALRKALDMPVK